MNKQIVDTSTMRKKAYLHLGLHKTGSSAIRTAMRKFHEEGVLKKYKYDFWDKEISMHELHRFVDDVDFCAKLIAKHIHTPERETWREAIVTTNAALSSYQKDGAYILTDKFAPVFAKAFEGYDVHISFYLRRQDIYSESFWAEMVKEGLYCGDLLTHIETREKHLYYKPLLDSYAKYFGKENITVRVYDRSQFYKGNIVNDFLHIVGLEDLARHWHEKHTNPSFSPAALRLIHANNAQHKLHKDEVAKHIESLDAEYEKGAITRTEYAIRYCYFSHGFDLYENTQRRTYIRLLSLYGLHGHGGKGYMQEDTRRAFLEKYKEDNAAVAREYLGREDGILFDDTMPKHIVDTGEPSGTDVAQVLLPIIAHLDERIEKLEKQCSEFETLFKNAVKEGKL